MFVAKNRNKLHHLTLTFCIILCAGLFVPTAVYSQIGFIAFKSETGLFKLRFPKKHEAKTNRIRVGVEVAAESGELIAMIDQRPFKDAVKNYVLKYDQTIGTPLSKKERIAIRDKEMAAYEDFYLALNGVVKDKQKEEDGDNASGRLYITYEDPHLGLQSIRSEIKINSTTKFQQILTGPDHIMYSLESKNYFDHLETKTGQITISADFKNDWTRHTSPLALFSYYLPAPDDVYMAKEPYTEHTDRSELVTFSFYDPIWKQKVFHRIFGYQFGTNLTFQAAKEVIFKRHSSRYFDKPTPMTFKTGQSDSGTPMVALTTPVTPPKDFPYLNTLRVRALFAGTYMLVHEIAGPEKLVMSNFTDRMINNFVEFTPEESYSAYKDKQNASAP